MKRVAGVDGCRGGWIMVRRQLAGGMAEVCVERRFVDLPEADIVAVDMPVGLPDSGARGCDLEARKLLGPRRFSVFIGLRRPLLDLAHDYPAANAWAKKDGAGLAKQAWNLLPKIAELDACMRPERQAKIREAHPELVFMALSDGPMTHPKRDARGFMERRQVLASAGLANLDTLLAALNAKEAAPDDLIDACVLSYAAERMARGEAMRLPPDPPLDSRGLRMEIWY